MLTLFASRFDSRPPVVSPGCWRLAVDAWPRRGSFRLQQGSRRVAPRENRSMVDSPAVRGVIPYVFCADAGAVADWLVEVLGFVERERWPDEDGVVRNVELVVGTSEVWLDGPVPNWNQGEGALGSWVGFLVDDVDETYERIKTAGVDLDSPRTREHGVREITVNDPEGHMWGFVQRLE